MPDEEGPPEEATLELAEDLLRDRLQAQRTAIERIETKATVLLGFGAAAAQFLLRSEATGGWLVAGLVFYGLTLVAGLAAIGVYEHQYPPEPGRLVEAYLDLPRAHVLDVLVRSRSEAFYENGRHMGRKRRAWQATLGLLVVAVVLSAVALAIAPERDDATRRREAQAVATAGPSG